MRFSNQKLLSKINEIRLLYIETNNNLCDSVEELAYSFISQHRKLQPSISTQVRETIENEMTKIREISVDNISHGFFNYFDYLKKNCERPNVQVPKRFSKKITDILEHSFKYNQYPSDFEKTSLAKSCNLTTKQINNWFTNKRNRCKNINKKYSYC